MSKKKYYNVQKLSTIISLASIVQGKKKLVCLRRLIAQSTAYCEELSQVIVKLRQVAAPTGEPFIFTTILTKNEELLRQVFADCGDIKFRSFLTGGKRALLIYLEGMSDTGSLEENIISVLMEPQGLPDRAEKKIPRSMQEISESVLGSISVKVVGKVSVAIEEIMIGSALLLIDGIAEVASIGAAQFVKRNISEANNEHVLRGPNEAFNEVLKDNIVLIRRRAHDANLKVHIIKIGRRSKTALGILYVDDLVKPGLVEEVERRLFLINNDKVLGIALIEEFLIDHPWSPFPQTQVTERPDKMLAALYEGRVAIMLDGTPVASIVPCTYNVLMQTTDDYNIQPVIGSLIRIMRGAMAFIAIYLPALYVAVVSYHPSMLPTNMAISVAELRARSPFPSFLEAVMMEILLEVFQEAVVRLPKKLSGAASMIGALVIGTTIVQAGLINPLLVVVVATTAIASYSIPAYNFSMALRWLRIPILILSSVLGLYGVILGILTVTIHLCSLRSFGESYLGGMCNVELFSDWKDSLVRFPAKLLKERPKEFGAQDQTRVGGNDG